MSRPGVCSEEYRTACLRFPSFPLQWLYRKHPEWQGRKVAWLEQLKPDSPLRYLSAEAQAVGLSPGLRYATALALAPDLLAGTCSGEALAVADKAIVKELRRFTPAIRRGSGHLANGLYTLDAQGLSLAFGGMRRWGQQLLEHLAQRGWQATLAIGFTPFACEMATYKLDPCRSLRLFQDRHEEQKQTMRMPLSAFGLSPDQVHRLRRFGVVALEDFLAFELEEVRRRFGSDLVEFYQKAGDALFAEFSPLPEEEPLWAQFGLPEPVAELQAILEIARMLLGRLLPRLIRREEGVSQLLLWMFTEDGGRLEQRLSPFYPTVDASWLEQLLCLRLEHVFQKCPLSWGRRVERVVVALVGQPDPEQQGELFSDLSVNFDDALQPRDRQAALEALSQVRAEYGDNCLRRVRLLNHPLPGRDYAWVVEKESQSWFSGQKPSSEMAVDRRVRRHLSRPLPLSNKDRWLDKEGPYLFSGGWWEAVPFVRQYFFARQGAQTGWLYWDELSECWFAQGWLQ